MKILYIIPSLQHPTIRGSTRHYHFVRELSKRHRITLLSLVRFKVTDEAVTEMESLTERFLQVNINGAFDSKTANRIRKLPAVGNFLEKRWRLNSGVKQMKRVFKQLVEQGNFDLIFFHGKSLFPVIEDYDGLPIVTDFCDATSMRIRISIRHGNWLHLPWQVFKLMQVRQTEQKMVQKTRHIAFISSRDRSAILGPDDHSEILPLGVDYHYWKRKSPLPEENCLVFTGVMNYAPNHDAAVYLVKKILPLLKKEIPDIKILLVGRHPKAALKHKAKHHPEVTVTGFVKDMRPMMEKAAVFIAPIRYASGTQNKILEAMAMEIPVITTSIVADGLKIDHANEPPLCKADDEQAFAEAVVQLLRNMPQRARLASEGRKFIKENFDWSRSADRLERMCRRAISDVGNME